MPYVMNLVFHNEITYIIYHIHYVYLFYSEFKYFHCYSVVHFWTRSFTFCSCRTVTYVSGFPSTIKMYKNNTRFVSVIYLFIYLFLGHINTVCLVPPSFTILSSDPVFRTPISKFTRKSDSVTRTYISFSYITSCNFAKFVVLRH